MMMPRCTGSMPSCAVMKANSATTSRLAVASIGLLGIGLIYYFVFILIIGRGGRLSGTIPESQYILYLMAGIFSFMWTSGVLSQATGALTGQKNLITTMNVPREVFPIGRVFARSAELLAGVPILMVISLVLGPGFRWSLLLLPVAMLVQGMFLIGIALILSSVNVMFRDVERFMHMIQRLIFYSSPILYPLVLVHEADQLPGWAKVLYCPRVAASRNRTG